MSILCGTPVVSPEGGGDFRVLVFSHDRALRAAYDLERHAVRIAGHWLERAFATILNKESDKQRLANMELFTVDVVDASEAAPPLTLGPSEMDLHTQYIKVDDAFSEDFVKDNIHAFDVVFIPDAGGPWYYEQTPSKGGSLASFMRLVRRIQPLIRPGGVMYMGKFIMDGAKEAVLSSFPTASVVNVAWSDNLQFQFVAIRH